MLEQALAFFICNLDRKATSTPANGRRLAQSPESAVRSQVFLKKYQVMRTFAILCSQYRMGEPCSPAA